MLKPVLLVFAAFVFCAEPQTKGKSEPKAAPQVRTEPATPVQGFAVAPMVLADEGCARDYVRAFQAEGVELRRRLADLEKYNCMDKTAKGIFAAVSTERRDFAVDKDHTAYFRKVTMTYDRPRTEAAVGNTLVNGPGSPVYLGWILDGDFYAVSPQRFDELLAQKKIPVLCFGDCR